MTLRKCLQCAGPISPTRSIATMFCNDACKSRFKGVLKSPPPIDYKICPVCNSKFVPEYQCKVYCNPACKNKVKNGKRKKRREKPATGPVEKEINSPTKTLKHEMSLRECQEYYGLNQRQPAIPKAKSLAECEDMKGYG